MIVTIWKLNKKLDFNQQPKQNLKQSEVIWANQFVLIEYEEKLQCQHFSETTKKPSAEALLCI